VPHAERVVSRVRRLPKRETFAFAMALVASIAAVVAVTQGGDDEPRVATSEVSTASTVD
jgi:hypothetical protein